MVKMFGRICIRRLGKSTLFAWI